MNLFLSRLIARFGLLTLTVGVEISGIAQNTLPPIFLSQAGVHASNTTMKQSYRPIRLKPIVDPTIIEIGKWLASQELLEVKENKTIFQTQRLLSKKPIAGLASDQAQVTKRENSNPSSSLDSTSTYQSTIDSALEIRVALVQGANTTLFATSNGGTIVSLDGEGLNSLEPEQSYVATVHNNQLMLNDVLMPGAVWVQADNGYVAIGDRWYRGRLLLLPRENGLDVINYVLLNEYLYSVVGAEMSASWPIEALKSQAIAARSYALVHSIRYGNRRDFDLDDTPRYQAYKGIVTETNTTQRAVTSTAGEFISNNGEIVESLYAATQEIVNDAHSGYGMSQMGALDMAQRGYQYNQILEFYYPQTVVERLDVSD